MEKKFLSKIVADKNNKKIGKVIRIDNKPDIVSKKLTPHLIIIIHRLFRKDLTISVSIEKISKLEGNYLWLDITEEELKKLLQDATILKEYRSEFLADKRYERPKESGRSSGRR